MKQILQDARTGEIAVAEVPAPQFAAAVRAGTGGGIGGFGRNGARIFEFASKGLVQKAKARPDLVRDVFTKLRRDGIASTWNAVHSRLDQPLALGTAARERWLGLAKASRMFWWENEWLVRALVMLTMRSLPAFHDCCWPRLIRRMSASRKRRLPPSVRSRCTEFERQR